ncbi:MAG: LamG domain-containing protein [Bacteroidales bacterium]|nr:LamG domain-containing protein [Bacteroidales bacterium]
MRYLISLLLLLPSLISPKAQETPEVTYWELNNLDNIGGFPITLVGSPSLIETELGTALEFNGSGDGIQIAANPLAGASEFTVEVIFKPYSGGLDEQRFVHMEQDNDNRILVELRSTAEDDWFLDTFIKSGSSSRTLYADTCPHAKDEWWHAALVYKDHVMTHYVNGVQELSDTVQYAMQSSGTTSIGVRNNLVSWYHGAIFSVRTTHQALTPGEFTLPDTSGSTPPDAVSGLQSDAAFRSYLLPNPVEDFTCLQYRLNKRCRVIVRIYDAGMTLLGEPINQVREPGIHRDILDCTELRQGVYFYTFEADSNLMAEKFLVAR